jgi:hypothetical protein
MDSTRKNLKWSLWLKSAILLEMRWHSFREMSSEKTKEGEEKEEVEAGVLVRPDGEAEVQVKEE